MVQKIQTILIDDLDPEVEAAATVAFALDGSMYEVDLSDEHASELRDALAPYIGAARRVAGSRTPRVNKRSGAKPAPSGPGNGPDPSVVRAWAQANNISVSARGRVKGTVIARFLQAKS